MNTEWKKGYEEGFAAGWKAAKESGLNHNSFLSINHGVPPSIYSGSITPHYSTMADQSPYHVVNTTTGYGTITLTEAKTDNSPAAPKKTTLKVVHNLTNNTENV